MLRDIGMIKVSDLIVRSPRELMPEEWDIIKRHPIDGAAMLDGEGVLRGLGVRLVPSVEAEGTVDAFGGTRHTSARRYSYDDPLATVIAVSEDGPVSVFRSGAVLGRSPQAG